MGEACRPWWRNCAASVDSEIEAIDAMEDALGDLDPGLARVRGLIGTLELCHHKAPRWIDNIVAAIAAGDTHKGLGTRARGRRHEAEDHWQDVCDELSAWCAGAPVPAPPPAPVRAPAQSLHKLLGERTPLKVWQVERVVEKVGSWIDWPDHDSDYVWLVLGEEGASECPERYRGHEDLWRATVDTTITHTVDGEQARLSLAVAIDMLFPCHWLFDENVRIVAAAIGGDLTPTRPFAACALNLSLLPGRERLDRVCATLRVFCGAESDGGIDRTLLSALGEPTPGSRWLAASLDKTIRLQLEPPAELEAELRALGM